MKMHAKDIARNLQTGRINSCRRLVVEATNGRDRALLGEAVEEVARGRKVTVVLDGAAELIVIESEEEQPS